MLVIKLCLFQFVALVSAKPNFVLILTDDQDLLLDSLTSMKRTLKLVANKGKVFTNAFVNSPICCPSRSTILTGMYAHNTGVVNNSLSGNCSSEIWQKYHEPYTVASTLKHNGYVTFYAGKYLNQYGSKPGGTKHIPKGYDWWIGLKGNSKYYNYTLSINGTAVRFGKEYLTDLLAHHSLEFLDKRPLSHPFLMIVAPPASHAPFTPAKRHEKAFPNVKALRNPSFNYTPTAKHWIVQMFPKHLPENVTILDNIQRHRFGSLLAVDELVKGIVKKLKKLGILNNTYIIFTSDNGFRLVTLMTWQFTQPWDKRQPYETDIRVPMFIRGPRVPRNFYEDHPVAMVDLAPTILDLAGVKVPPYMDGDSFKSVLLSDKEKSYRRRVFVEYWGEGNGGSIDQNCPVKYDRNLAECSREGWCKCQDSRNNTYSCVLDLSDAQKIKFCRFKDLRGFVEVYNLTEDPHELVNIYKKMDRDTVRDNFNILNRFEDCSGNSCRML